MQIPIEDAFNNQKHIEASTILGKYDYKTSNKFSNFL